MPPPFSQEEYQTRLEKVRTSMAEKNLDAMLIGDPANMNWLTGFDAWSFYVPQVMLVHTILIQFGWVEKWMRVPCH